MENEKEIRDMIDEQIQFALKDQEQSVEEEKNNDKIKEIFIDFFNSQKTGNWDFKALVSKINAL